MPLKKLVLENFQVHPKLSLDLDPHITCIIGPSDVGKSAVIRALRWLCQNVPDGAEFIRDGTKQAIVTLQADGKTIIRTRGTENSYQLGREEFKAFGKSVPEEIIKLVRVDDINFQGQHDSPFWFAESAGEVARHLNRIVNLDVIDRVLADIAAKKREADQACKLLEERLKAAKQQKDSLQFVVGLNKELKILEDRAQRLSQSQAKRKALSVLVEKLQNLRTARDTAQKVANRGVSALDIALKALETSQLLSKLQSLVGRAKTLSRARKLSRPDFDPIEKLRASYDSVYERWDNLTNQLDSLRTLWRRRKETKERADTLAKDLDQKTEGRCPLCGGLLDETHRCAV
jgi:exonuclease SbcC